MTAEVDNINTNSILTDARDSWKKNATQTDVVCVGVNTKHVLYVSTITKKADDAAERHELRSTKQLYDLIKGNGLTIAAHRHGDNAFITKYVQECQPVTRNQLDSRHTLISFARTITKGPEKNYGLTWHFQLSDKEQALRTHVKFCLSRCNGDTETLPMMLSACVEYFKKILGVFRTGFKLRVFEDHNYRLCSRADAQRRHYRQQCVQKAALYSMNMSTAHAESFNNQLSIFKDKRIYFGNLAYKMRIKLATCVWNENRTLKCKKRSHEVFQFRHQIL